MVAGRVRQVVILYSNDCMEIGLGGLSIGRLRRVVVWTGLTVFITCKAAGFPGIVSSITQPRWVTCECCFVSMSLNFILSFFIFLILHWLANRIDSVFSSPKWILNLLSTNQSQIFSESLFNAFSISSTSLCWKIRNELSAYINKLEFTASDVSVIEIRNSEGPRIEPCGTPLITWQWRNKKQTGNWPFHRFKII